MTPKVDIYKAVSDRIIAGIETGVAPWAKPWHTSGGFPYSIRSGKPYRGVNVLLLAMSGYDDPRWGTYKAITEAGGQVRKGEHGTQIVLWKPVVTHDKKTDDDHRYWLLRFYTVFNARQADNLPELPVEEEREFTPIEAAEQIANGYVWTQGSDNPGPSVLYGLDQAAYSPAKDRVEMPTPAHFVADEPFYTTLFHELVHSTGHEKRLARIEPALFGTDKYAREELVAEIGASFLAGVAEFTTAGGDQSAAYVKGWLEPLRNDPKFVVQAASAAQKAADLILGITFDNEKTEAATPVAVPA